MFRSFLNLSVAIPAATAAGAPGAPLRAHAGGPNSVSRVARLAVVLATCSFVAFVGWILATGVFDLEPGELATGAAARVCEPSNCRAALTPVYRPLPREWRWEKQKIEFEHMYRN